VGGPIGGVDWSCRAVAVDYRAFVFDTRLNTVVTEETFDASYPGSILSQKTTEDICCFTPSKEPVLEYLKALPIQP